MIPRPVHRFTTTEEGTMGLFDKIKNKVNEITQQPPPTTAPKAPPPKQPEPEEEEMAAADEDDGDTESDGEFDVAGFDPDDEESFFNAVLHMESEGEFGGTDESRAQIMEQFGIRDRSHWQTVKESVYSLLIQKHGSMEVVGQRESNWRMGQMQNRMQANVAKKAASGEMNPVEGISLEDWAAKNAAIVSGANLDDLLKGAGVDRARWDRVNAEWNARMSRDTTFAIATTYGNAFQAASKGKYAAYAKEANAARAENRDLKMEMPVTHEQYWEIMYEQSYAAKQGQDPVAALKNMGLTIVDWVDLSSFVGYHFERTHSLHQKEYEEIHKRVAAKFEAKYPGVKPDVDIQF
jgi:hypothetical protein